ncbi:MAG TPA: hypothetical protein VGB24_19630 [Longimicrobium sp.]|jgi:hypothetical protein|uniref:hypothetical protein n=1 Tax=Longimicrobium sp. TaxID=2029185 RepID=UPI002EDAA06B
MTFEEALDHPGPLLAAWDLTPVRGERTLTLYSLADDRATALAHDSAPVGEEDAASAPLRARGIPIGKCDRGCEFVWISDAGGVVVWGPHWRVLDARGASLSLADGRTMSPDQIERVFACASDDYVSRGVRARLRSGEEVSLVRDISASAAADPAYSRNELLWDTGWAGSIARAVAAWAGAPYENRI